MTDTFKTAMIATGDGFLVFPAVGMGVCKGDPSVYWYAFLDAVIDCGSNVKQIFVNPGHAPTPYGRFEGCTGNEFKLILEEFLNNKKDTKGYDNLKKVYDLFEQKTDVVQLSYNLKKSFSNDKVYLYNASDPDVTLGNHVGEYTNNCPHTSTTEENYTAMGTNGLCFETITKVFEGKDRVIQVNFNQ